MAKINIKQMAKDDLSQLLMDSLSQSFKLQVQKSTQQLKDVNQIRFVRRNIARIKTELRQRGEQV